MQAETLVVALVFTTGYLRADLASETRIAEAFAAMARTMSRARTTTETRAINLVFAAVACIAGLTEAATKLAVTVSRAFAGATLDRAVKPFVPSRARARASIANTVP